MTGRIGAWKSWGSQGKTSKGKTEGKEESSTSAGAVGLASHSLGWAEFTADFCGVFVVLHRCLLYWGSLTCSKDKPGTFLSFNLSSDFTEVRNLSKGAGGPKHRLEKNFEVSYK